MAQACAHVEGAANKHDPGLTLHPETVVYRGRKYDYYNLFFPENFSRCYPGLRPKPLAIHKHKDDEYAFYTHPGDDREYFDMRDHGIPIYDYVTIDNLYKNLVPAGINVVMEPQKYYLPPHIVKKSLLKKFKPKEAESKEEAEKQYEAYLKKIERRVLLPVAAPSSLWWFEFLDRIMEIKRRSEFISVFIDEAHQVFSYDSEGDHWKFIGWVANSIIDLRRMNISLFMNTHDTALIDYRVRYRVEYFLWMKGSIPDKGRSRLSPHVIPQLSIGESIIEKLRGEFGFNGFDKIQHQPPIIQVEGLSEGI
jgi:hypothetical protein